MTNDPSFSPSMKMAELLERDSSLLGVFARMGLTFGYGDATVKEVCTSAGIDAGTFLIICKVYSDDSYRPAPEEFEGADNGVIVTYLSRSHDYYINVALKDLAADIGRMMFPCEDAHQKVIWKFFTDFKDELLKHFEYEEKNVFPYVTGPGEKVPMGSYEEDHSGTEETLEDLKNLVMTHLPASADQQEAFKVLSGITSLQSDIRKHILLEETALEGRSNKEAPSDDDTLSPREKEILVCVAKGMLNKEIADANNISIHTVITHRKNITRKTGIKTVAGLTVYALLNNLIDINTIE
ncbi:MAG: hemerythrin domain-containing protein [Bacteroidales bacterium]|nr:hemerythrin domain-containing protein [Bacteroidales bacterium]